MGWLFGDVIPVCETMTFAFENIYPTTCEFFVGLERVRLRKYTFGNGNQWDCDIDSWKDMPIVRSPSGSTCRAKNAAL